MKISRLRARARHHARRSEWSAAAQCYEAIEARRRATGADRVQLAHALKESGDSSGALRAYWSAASGHPLLVTAQRELGNFLRGVGQHALAADAYARAWVLDPEIAGLEAEIAALTPEVGGHGVRSKAFDDLLLRGLLAGEGGGVPRRRNFMRVVLAGGAIWRARAHARAGRWQLAEKSYRAALRLRPYLGGALVQLGHASRAQGKFEASLCHYRQALLVAPRDPDIYVHLGHALKALGRPESALTAYLTAWRLKPGFSAAAQEARHIRPDISDAWLLSGAHGLPGETEASHGRVRLAHPPAESRDWRSALAVATAGRQLKPTFDFLAGSLSHKF